MGAFLPSIVLVTRETRLRGMLSRWGTLGQAAFNFRQAKVQERVRAGRLEEAAQLTKSDDAEFDSIVSEDDQYSGAVKQLRIDLDMELPVAVIDRTFLPSFNFSMAEVVVVVGQDGLVANTAKYVGNVPIIGVNPDPQRIDGVLLPFRVPDARPMVQRVLAQRAHIRQVSLAECSLQDGQRMLAFNDFFVGVNSHVSARYRLTIKGRSEQQSSSGLIVSTGAGSTGWMSSVFNMAAGIAAMGDKHGKHTAPPRLDWSARELLWAVREPFVSRTSSAGLVAGRLVEHEELVVESAMPTGGVIFSDGVESDFLPFQSGSIARIGVAKQQARLVVK